MNLTQVIRGGIRLSYRSNLEWFAMNSLIISMIGEDRPGLVERLAQCVADHEGSWIESSFARLAGKFAGVARVVMPSAQVSALQQTLGQMANEMHLQISAERADADDQAQENEQDKPIGMNVVGLDRAGIVKEISAALAARGVNVLKMQSSAFNAPMSGERMFEMQATLSKPTDLSMVELNQAFDAVESTMGVEVSLIEPTSS